MSAPLPLLFLALLLACSSSPPPGETEPDTRTRANIENRSSLDMDVYVRRSNGTRSRLGFAPGNETTSFTLPEVVTAGSSFLTFEAIPARGGGQRVVSEPFAVRRGDEITWSVPPQ